MATGWQRFRRLCGRPAGRLVCWFGLFTLLVVIDAVQLYAGQRFEDFTITWPTALRRGCESNYTMAVLGLGVLWLARRFPFDRAHGWRWFARHFGLALVYAAVYSATYALLVNGQMSVKGKVFVFPETFKKLIVFYTYGNVGFYWLVVLAHHGWHYYQRYRERERRTVELEGQLARAQLQALRMQLNPHFLFNALNTVAALIHEQPEIADRTVTRLSELLRVSLDRSNDQEIPLGQELDFLDRYLEIEQTRFGDRLHVTIEVPDALKEAFVPALVLQPIVENAIRHGIEERETGGRIVIRAARRDGQLELTVTDNGPGLAAGETTFKREGIGLSNTRSRLRHLYGECQGLELRPAEGGGLEVRIHLPLRTPRDPVPQPQHPAVVVGCNPPLPCS